MSQSFEDKKVEYLGLKGIPEALTEITEKELKDILQIIAFQNEKELVEKFFSEKNEEIDDFFKTYVDTFIKLRVSSGRKGRKELLAVGKGSKFQSVFETFLRKKTPTYEAESD